MEASNGLDLRARVRNWIDGDLDPASQAELRALLDAPDLAKTDLADRFAGSLEFGTAGLRGVIGAGPNRMNLAVIARTTHGLAKHLLASVEGAAARGVVIGFDGRRMSREFSDLTAEVLASHGIRVHLFEDYAPTPLTAFAITAMNAAAGVMVTASHNPPEYNGYKAYWTNGAQIVPPTDVAIAHAIDAAPAAKDVPRLPIAEARAKGLVTPVPAEVITRYVARVRALETHADGDRALSIVYTPMHGVGGKLAKRVFAEAGFPNVHVVAAQAEPDGAFPTVRFPNPEEKGAMDLSFALAREKKAALVLANDPDADRLAVAIPGKTASEYVQLTGNQVGALLGEYLLSEGAKRDGDGARLVVTTIVSSPLLLEIARAHGASCELTLTGFKWIANLAMDREREGMRFVFGYEEALGYSVGDVVRDKDGVSAAVIFAELTAWLRARGQTVHDRLEGIARAHGLYASSQVNVVRPGAEGASEIRAVMETLRAWKPSAIGGRKVMAIRDYERKVETRAGGVEVPLTLPKSNVLAFDLEGGSRIVARPSGTEPKAKFYFDVREAVGPGEPLSACEARAEKARSALEKAFFVEAGVSAG